MKDRKRRTVPAAIGIDVGDRTCQVCVLSAEGEVLEERSVATTRAAIEGRFKAYPKTRDAIEAGTHSAWIHEAVQGVGHEVIIANPQRAVIATARKLAVIMHRMWTTGEAFRCSEEPRKS